MSVNAQDWKRLSPSGDAEVLPQIAANDQRLRQWRYVSVRFKFVLTLCVSLAWAVYSYTLARRWINELSGLEGAFLAHLM